MKIKQSAITLLLGSALAFAAFPSNACFTVIVGKGASATGEIMVGHNEDNDGRIMSNQYYVPAAKHKKGEKLVSRLPLQRFHRFLRLMVSGGNKLCIQQDTRTRTVSSMTKVFS